MIPGVIRGVAGGGGGGGCRQVPRAPVLEAGAEFNGSNEQSVQLDICVFLMLQQGPIKSLLDRMYALRATAPSGVL